MRRVILMVANWKTNLGSIAIRTSVGRITSNNTMGKGLNLEFRVVQFSLNREGVDCKADSA